MKNIGKVSGYEAVNVLFTANHWRGLEYNGSIYTI